VSAPVKTFFVELTGGWRAEFEDGSTIDFPNEDAARASNYRSLSPLYKLPDGRVVEGSELPPGATYLREESFWERGPDGLHVVVVCPDGWHWSPDSRASNCTRKDDKVHRCWCRHGDPRKGTLHVDKVGNTCNAGAGSILTGRTPAWHGFLSHGILQEQR
jgi:hypothetical protein